MMINPNRFMQVFNETSTRLSQDGLAKITDVKTTLNFFDDGKVTKVNNMLDAFIAATGTVVEKYNSPKAIDYIA